MKGIRRRVHGQSLFCDKLLNLLLRLKTNFVFLKACFETAFFFSLIT